MNRRRSPSSVLLLLLLCIGCAPTQGPGEALVSTLGESDDALRVSPAALPDQLERLDTLGMSQAIELLRLPGERWGVVDAGDAEVRITGAQEGLLTLGRRGNGPGEMRRPVGALAWADSVAVCDSGRGRMLLFLSDSDEAPVEIPMPRVPMLPGQFGMTREGSFVIPSIADSAYYGELIDRAGVASPWGRRIPELPAPDSGPFSLDQVAGKGDTLVVLDSQNGAIVLMNDAGVVIHGFRLPESVLAAVDAYLDEQIRLGRAVAGRPLLAKVSFPEAGGLLVRLAGRPGGILGLWVDLENGLAHPLVAGGGDPEGTRDVLWASAATEIIGRGPFLLVALTRNGLFAFNLEGEWP